jgi:voltage-gated potassium channel
MVIAPARSVYLRENWLTAVALLLPAFRAVRLLRALRALRAARVARSVALLRVITSLNRGMRAVNRALGRRGVGYVVALTAVVTVAGAAGMAQFESPAALRQAGRGDVADAGGGLGSYGEALWWTAMIITTMGSEYWPRTLEGRVLGWLLALYAFAIFGYITATIASLFLGRDAAGPPGPDRSELVALHAEVVALRAQVAEMAERLPAPRTIDPAS